MILLCNRLRDTEDDGGGGMPEFGVEQVLCPHRRQELFSLSFTLALPQELMLREELPKNSALGSVIGATSAGTITGDFHSHKQQQKHLVFIL